MLLQYYCASVEYAVQGSCKRHVSTIQWSRWLLKSQLLAGCPKESQPLRQYCGAGPRCVLVEAQKRWNLNMTAFSTFCTPLAAAGTFALKNLYRDDIHNQARQLGGYERMIIN